mmetsp:Transcript_50729/g.122356  ORF Transcript_50729/g.122356 Transcript_50729/m.122356 type:complete len:357 (+) Transcript_50729:326-1396(+)
MMISSVMSRRIFVVTVKTAKQQPQLQSPGRIIHFDVQRGARRSSFIAHGVHTSRRYVSTPLARPKPTTKRGRRHVSSSTNATAAQELHDLKLEVKALQQVIREGLVKTNQVETMTRSLSERTSSLEQVLGEINTRVSRINAVETMLTNARDYILQHNPALQELQQTFETFMRKSRPFLIKNYRSILASLVLLTVVWKYRSNIFYQRASEDVADLAKRTLEQESLRRTIQETLYTIASDPQTLKTLNDLLQQIIQHKQTQHELINLIVFAAGTREVQAGLMDLCQALLEDPKARKMIDVITADVVRDTLDDDSVQQASAVGFQRSLWYAVTPSFLWRYFEKNEKATKDGGDGDGDGR